MISISHPRCYPVRRRVLTELQQLFDQLAVGHQRVALGTDKLRGDLLEKPQREIVFGRLRHRSETVPQLSTWGGRRNTIKRSVNATWWRVPLVRQRCPRSRKQRSSTD